MSEERVSRENIPDSPNSCNHNVTPPSSNTFQSHAQLSTANHVRSTMRTRMDNLTANIPKDWKAARKQFLDWVSLAIEEVNWWREEVQNLRTAISTFVRHQERDLKKKAPFVDAPEKHGFNVEIMSLANDIQELELWLGDGQVFLAKVLKIPKPPGAMLFQPVEYAGERLEHRMGRVCKVYSSLESEHEKLRMLWQDAFVQVGLRAPLPLSPPGPVEKKP